MCSDRNFGSQNVLQICQFFNVTVVDYCKIRKSIFSKANSENSDGESIIFKFYNEKLMQCTHILISTTGNRMQEAAP